MTWVIRIVAGLCAILSCAVVVLLFLGSRPGASDIKTSIEIARPPADIWPYIREGDKLKSWISWLVDVRNESPTPDAVGAKFVWVMEDRNNNNEKMEIHSEVTAIQPPNVLSVKMGGSGAFTGIATYRLTPIPLGTRLELESHYEFTMWFARLMSPIIMPAARKKMNGDLARLKANTEKPI